MSAAHDQNENPSPSSLPLLSENATAMTEEAKRRNEEAAQKLKTYLRIFLVPTLINKAFILYFGLKYSQYPDEGYGWGLVITISLTLLSFAYFIYINWGIEEL